MKRLRAFIFLAVLSSLTAGCAIETVHDEPASPVPMKEGVRQAMNGKARDIRKCQDSAEKRDPKISGKVILSWVIDDKGKASEVSVVNKNSTIEDKDFRACLVQVITETDFPAAALSNTVKIDSYPITVNVKD